MKIKLSFLLPIFCLLLSSCAFSAAPPQAPTGLRCPPGAIDSHNIWLVWDRPARDDTAVTFNIYVNGQRIRNIINSTDSIGIDSICKFQAANPESGKNLLSLHNYTSHDLMPDTSYSFTIRAVSADGHESADSAAVVLHTPPLPQRLCITDFGAVGDGKTLSTSALQQAIDACPAGGIVEIPAGTFVSGALNLKSNMTLQLDAGAVLLSSSNPDDYTLMPNHRCNGLLNGDGLENLRIIGSGTIDGNGWQRDSGKQRYLKANNKETNGQRSPNHVLNIGILAKNQTQAMLDAGFGFKQAYIARSAILELHKIHNLYIEGITLQNPSLHVIGASMCTQTTLNNVKIDSYDCNNGDGIDFQGQDLIIANCWFNTGDDSVDFSAGTGEAAASRPPVSNLWIFNNYFAHGHGAIVCGSHTGSWIEKLLAEDNVIEGSDIGLRCKTSETMGGGARDSVFRHNIMKNLKRNAFIFTTAYTDVNAAGSFAPASPGQFHDFLIEDCYIDGVDGPAIEVEGLAEMPHKDLTFRRVQILHAQENKLAHVENFIFEK